MKIPALGSTLGRRTDLTLRAEHGFVHDPQVGFEYFSKPSDSFVPTVSTEKSDSDKSGGDLTLLDIAHVPLSVDTKSIPRRMLDFDDDSTLGDGTDDPFSIDTRILHDSDDEFEFGTILGVSDDSTEDSDGSTYDDATDLPPSAVSGVIGKSIEFEKASMFGDGRLRRVSIVDGPAEHSELASTYRGGAHMPHSPAMTKHVEFAPTFGNGAAVLVGADGGSGREPMEDSVLGSAFGAVHPRDIGIVELAIGVPELALTFGGDADVAHLLGESRVMRWNTSRLIPSAHAVKVRPPRHPMSRRPTAAGDSVTVVLSHLPASTDIGWLAAWINAMGSDAAIFADVRPSLVEDGDCHNVGYITFAHHAGAIRFFRRMGRSRDCGWCSCEASWASGSRQGLETQVRGVVFRQKTAPIARNYEGKWALAEKLPLLQHMPTVLGEGWRRSPEFALDFTTVIVAGLPDEFVNAHLVDWLSRLGPAGRHANFARLIASPYKGYHLTTAVVNFDSHAEAEAFIRHQRGDEASPCADRGKFHSFTAEWAPPESQGLEAQMAAIPNWFGSAMFRDVGGLWSPLQVDPFNDVATAVQMMGGTRVHVDSQRGCNFD